MSSVVISPRDFDDQNSHDAAVIKAIENFGGQAVVLAGYMSILGKDLVKPVSNCQYPPPALIPSFCGKRLLRTSRACGSVGIWCKGIGRDGPI